MILTLGINLHNNITAELQSNKFLHGVSFFRAQSSLHNRNDRNYR